MNRREFMAVAGLASLIPKRLLASDWHNAISNGKAFLIEDFHSNINDVDVQEVDEWRHVWFGKEKSGECLSQSIYDKYSNEPSLPYSWDLVLVQENKPMVLVDYVESNVPFKVNEVSDMGFHEWLANFNPETWADWLMVPVLYRIRLTTGGSGYDFGDKHFIYPDILGHPAEWREILQLSGCESDHAVSRFLYDWWVYGDLNLALKANSGNVQSS